VSGLEVVERLVGQVGRVDRSPQDHHRVDVERVGDVPVTRHG
jgi:hypothetical protein